MSKGKARDVSDLFTEVKLPSNGLLKDYPSSIKISWLKVKDEKKLLSCKKEDLVTTMIEVMNSRLEPGESFRVENLTVSDFEYLTLMVRINSVGPVFEYLITCGFCKRTSPVSVNVTKLEISELHKGYKEPINLEFDNKKLSLRFPRMHEFLWVEKNVEKAVQDKGMLAMALANYDTPEKKLEAFDKITIKDQGYVKRFLEVFGYGIDFVGKTKCQGCAKEVTYPIPFREKEFFRAVEISESDFGDAVVT